MAIRAVSIFLDRKFAAFVWIVAGNAFHIAMRAGQKLVVLFVVFDETTAGRNYINFGFRTCFTKVTDTTGCRSRSVKKKKSTWTM